MISKHIIPQVKSSFPSTVPIELVTNFLALSIGYIFSRFFHHAVAHFHAFSTGLHVYFSSFHQLDVFPRFSPVSCFLAFRTAYMFSRSFRGIQVFPRLSAVLSRLPLIARFHQWLLSSLSLSLQYRCRRSHDFTIFGCVPLLWGDPDHQDQ